MKNKRTWLYGYLLLLTVALLAPPFPISKPAPVATQTQAPLKDLPVEPTKVVITRDDIYLAINEQRRLHGVKDLEKSVPLNDSAQQKCDDMVAHKYYGHENPTTGKQGYSYIFDANSAINFGGENLNRGLFLKKTYLIDSWMNSADHRDAILDPTYTSTGVAVCEVNGQQTYVQHFGKIEQQEYVEEGCPVTTCYDGWCSGSTGRGTCSSHGGIRY